MLWEDLSQARSLFASVCVFVPGFILVPFGRPFWHTCFQPSSMLQRRCCCGHKRHRPHHKLQLTGLTGGPDGSWCSPQNACIARSLLFSIPSCVCRTVCCASWCASWCTSWHAVSAGVLYQLASCCCEALLTQQLRIPVSQIPSFLQCLKLSL